MRTLAIMLFASTICYGQGMADSSYVKVMVGQLLKFDTEEYLDNVALEQTWGLSRLWKQYKAECWNDSTKHDRCNDCDYSVKDVERRYPYCSDDLKRMICTDTTHLHFIAPRASDGDSVLLRLEWIARFYYTHREPTFIGFIDWIERRRK
jgi:hypothetical protein